MTGRVLLCGMDNPYGSDPAFALFCYPPNSAGYRLRRILGLPQHQYLALHRTNLCTGSWSMRAAKTRVWDLLSPESPWRVIVMLGREVTTAFEKVALPAPIPAFTSTVCCPGMTLVSLPHPSGLNRAWNAPTARERAQEILRGVAPEVAWGSADEEGEVAA